MSIEVKVPVLPESVSDATIATWHKKPGDAIKRDENLVDLETDKVVLEVPSPVDGVLKEIVKDSGATVTGEEVIARVEEGVDGKSAKGDGEDRSKSKGDKDGKVEGKEAKAAKGKDDDKDKDDGDDDVSLSPAARRVVEEHDVDPGDVEGTGRRGMVTKGDVLKHIEQAKSEKPAPKSDKAETRPADKPKPAPRGAEGERRQERVPMTRMRARIAERMMQSKNSIAMLTSFNEIDMRAVMTMRKSLGEAFEKAHGIRLGVMSFFVRAAAEALRRHPVVNASVDGNDILYHDYADISIAVSTDRGLVTPVLRDADRMSFADVERAINDYAKKAREGGLAIEDLQGGTFTITNGGVFGSLMSTPIVNPPQSAILGMHAIKERPVVDNGQVVAAPMMYIALSYDHRIIDGKDAVTFLVDIKNQLENPHKMLLGI